MNQTLAIKLKRNFCQSTVFQKQNYYQQFYNPLLFTTMENIIIRLLSKIILQLYSPSDFISIRQSIHFSFSLSNLIKRL